MKHSDRFPNCFYRVTTKALVLKDKKILLQHEDRGLGQKWELPGGGLEFGNNFHEELQREVLEESGLKLSHINKKPTYIWVSEIHKDTEKWFYSLALGFYAEIESFDSFKSSKECTKYRFFSKDDLTTIPLLKQTAEFAKIFKPHDIKKEV